MGAGLSAALLTLLFAQLLVMVSPWLFGITSSFGASNFVFGLVGTVFSLYIVYDVSQIATRVSVDEFVPAAIELYLDIINLFILLLRIAQAIQGFQEEEAQEKGLIEPAYAKRKKRLGPAYAKRKRKLEPAYAT